MINKEGKRALAHIETIVDIQPIEGADRIEVATVLGWKVVIAKADGFKIGDEVIYIEIDSKVPDTDERFAFLQDRKYRVKTIKLKGQYSQGLIMPKSVFPEVAKYTVGDDVTDILHIKYYVNLDEIRKNGDPDAKYKSMSSRHQKIAKTKVWRWLYRRTWGKQLLFVLFGNKKDKPLTFPTKFEFVHKTDEERCLWKDTKIFTNKGLIRIADIVNKKLDVKVLSYNNSNEPEYKNIVEYQKFSIEPDLIKITFPYRYGVTKLNSLVCTKDHKIFCNRGYIRADELTLNDEVFLMTNTLSEEAIEYLYGSILGDGHLIFDRRSSNNKVGFSICQGENHLEYLKILNNLFNGQPIRQEFSGFKPENKVFKFGLSKLDILSYYLNKDGCLKDNSFIITKEFCDRITEKTLAIWYLDDGSCSFDGDTLKKSAGFASCAFSKEENELLANCLREKFGLSCKVVFCDGYYSIDLNRESSRKLFEIIADYVPYSMKYKLPESLRQRDCKLNDVKLEFKNILLPVSINSIETVNLKGSKYVYDIKVEDNHNFIASGILNHNCENMPWILTNKDPWVKTCKIDGTSATYILERKKFGKYEFYVTSRNVRQKTTEQKNFHNDCSDIETNVYWDMAIKYDIEEHLKEYLNKHKDCWYVCLQGEIAGPGIQGNPHKLPTVSLYGFNWIDSVHGRYSSVEGRKIWEDFFGGDWVPIIDTNYILPDTMEEMKLSADGPCDVPHSSGLREGFVYRSQDGQKSFKNVSRKYIMKQES